MEALTRALTSRWDAWAFLGPLWTLGYRRVFFTQKRKRWNWRRWSLQLAFSYQAILSFKMELQGPVVKACAWLAVSGGSPRTYRVQASSGIPERHHGRENGLCMCQGGLRKTPFSVTCVISGPNTHVDWALVVGQVLSRLELI